MKNYMKILSAVLFMFCYNTDNCSAEQVNGTTNQDQTIQTIPDIVNSIQQDRNKQEIGQGQNTGAYDTLVKGLIKSSLIGNTIQQVQNSNETMHSSGQSLTTNNTQPTDMLNTTGVSDPTTGIGQLPTTSQPPVDMNSQQIQNNTGQLQTIGNIITGTKVTPTAETMITSNTNSSISMPEQSQNIEQIMDDTEQLTTLAQNLVPEHTNKPTPGLQGQAIPEQQPTNVSHSTGIMIPETPVNNNIMPTIGNITTSTEPLTTLGSMITTPTTTTDVANRTQTTHSTQQNYLINNAIQHNSTETMLGLKQSQTPNQTPVNTQPTQNNTEQLQTLGNTITGMGPLPTVETMI